MLYPGTPQYRLVVLHSILQGRVHKASFLLGQTLGRILEPASIPTRHNSTRVGLIRHNSTRLGSARHVSTGRTELDPAGLPDAYQCLEARRRCPPRGGRAEWLGRRSQAFDTPTVNCSTPRALRWSGVSSSGPVTRPTLSRCHERDIVCLQCPGLPPISRPGPTQTVCDQHRSGAGTEGHTPAPSVPVRLSRSEAR